MGFVQTYRQKPRSHQAVRMTAKYRAWRKRNPAKAVAARIRWFRKHCIEWDEELRKKRCRALRANATRYGLLPKPTTCQICGLKANLQAHHSNYSDPLAVIWCCGPDHKGVDRLREKRLKITRNNRGSTRFLTAKEYDQIKALWAEGNLSQVRIAQQFNCTNSAVSRIVTGKSKPRKLKLITINGKTRSLAAWLNKSPVVENTYYDRLARGWSIKEALLTPPGRKPLGKRS